MRRNLPKARSTRKGAVTLRLRLRRVKLFLCDVDGILTDGTVFITSDGEMKQFNILDGLGLRFLQQHGVKVGWISNRPSRVTERRATELKVDFLVQQKGGTKVAAVEKILAETGLTFDDVCFMGDDIVDVAVLRRAGLAVAVPAGIAETKQLAHYITEAAAGRGAVREVAEMILKAQGKWSGLVQEFLA